MSLPKNVTNTNSVDNKENETDNEGAAKKEKELSLSRKVSFIRESVSDSGVPERKLSTSVSVDAAKRSSLHSQDQGLHSAGESPKVPRKFIATWRHACDRTKDRTRELLKRWRTLPEGNTEMAVVVHSEVTEAEADVHSSHNWSVHVWASYIKRYPSEEDLLDSAETAPLTNNLSPTQKEKLGHFFSHLLDTDHDDLISLQDFEHFSERLRRFADWSTNSPEFLITLQVQHALASTFLPPSTTESEDKADRWKQYSGLELWFHRWSGLLDGASSLRDCPVWLQYLPKLLFQAINRSGSGSISRDELSAFYSSMVGLSSQRVGEILDQSFNTLTSNGDHPVSFSVYRLAFANFLLGRHPNGPGQVLFGCVARVPACFPIDYSALNTQPGELEHYSPDKRTNRVSVIV